MVFSGLIPRAFSDRRAKANSPNTGSHSYSSSSGPSSVRSSQVVESSGFSRSIARRLPGSIAPDPPESSQNRSATTPVMATSENKPPRPFGRRERNLINTPCAFCEEPLQHTLAGERVLHFTCSHVAHEECLYETVRETEMAVCPICDTTISLDVTRGGSKLDIEKLASAVRSTQVPSIVSAKIGPVPAEARWEGRPSGLTHTPAADMSFKSSRSQFSRVDSTDPEQRAGRQFNQFSSTRIPPPGHSNPASDYGDASLAFQPRGVARPRQSPPRVQTRPADYDSRSIDSAGPIQPSRPPIRNGVPLPTVTIKSEFPTLTTMATAQNITCIVSVVVQDGWKMHPLDFVSVGVAPAVSTPMQRQTSNAASVGPAADRNAFASRPSVSEAIDVQLPADELDRIANSLRTRVDHWHNLDFNRFGHLLLNSHIRVGKDGVSWQDLECYLFSEMLICIKDKRSAQAGQEDGWPESDRRVRSTLKGSILIQKHLQSVEVSQDVDGPILTLSLSVPALPSFHLKFTAMSQLLLWQKILVDICNLPPPAGFEQEVVQPSADDDSAESDGQLRSSVNSSGFAGSYQTAPTAYSTSQQPGVAPEARPVPSLHVPLDIVVVVPVYSSMQGLKISLLRDTLRFIVASLGDRDRMGVVTFGSSNGSEPLVGLSSKTWRGWSTVLDRLRPVGQKNPRADVVDGTNVAMNLLMQRRAYNPVAAILLISDSSSADQDGIDFVVSRAEAAKVGVHSFGLGLSHKPDTMIELSTRTQAPYTYVKDWMMLRESVAGCIGALQSISHQNAKLRLRIPEGSPIKFVKISGALSTTKRASGRDADASLGDLMFGSRRDILVQLSVLPDVPTEPVTAPHDPWESLVSGLEALGNPDSLTEPDEYRRRHLSVDEFPLLQADLVFGDVLQGGSVTNLSRPTLLTLPRLPSNDEMATPVIPPNTTVVQRRMELLTSDMLSRALGLVSRGQHDRAHHLLTQTQSIVAMLGSGNSHGPAVGLNGPAASPINANGTGIGVGVGYIPTHMAISQPIQQQQPATMAPTMAPVQSLPPIQPPQMAPMHPTVSATDGAAMFGPQIASPVGPQGQPPTVMPPSTMMTVTNMSYPLQPMVPTMPSVFIDQAVVAALDQELASALEWMLHPAIFGRDARKAVLQSVGVIASQRAYTFHTRIEQMYAGRVSSLKGRVEASRSWREEEEGIREEM